MIAQEFSALLNHDAYKALESLEPGMLAKFLCVDCNAGLARPERELMVEAVDDHFTAKLRASAYRMDGAPQNLAFDELEASLRDKQVSYLEQSESRRSAAEPRTQAKMLLTQDTDRELVKPLLTDNAALFPRLPWGKENDAQVELPGFATLSSSFRTIGYVPDTGAPAVLKIHPSATARPLSKAGFSTRLLARAKRRFIMGGIFGVDRFDGHSIEEIDVLHSLLLSHRIKRILSDRQPEFAIMLETAALVDANGHGCLIRDPTPFPRPASNVIAIPYLSVLGNPRFRLADLFKSLSASSGLGPAEFAVDLGRRYLHAWYFLWLRCGILFLMPHGQNAFFELLPGNRIGRVVIKDMRDMEEWRTYRRLTHTNTRLSFIDSHYARYQMAVHPLYYDVQRWRDPDARIAANVFSYSFQMLRNYVLRGLEVAAEALDKEASVKVRAAFADVLEDLAAEPAGLGSDPQLNGQETLRAHPERITSAWRSLRRRWVEWALDH